MSVTLPNSLDSHWLPFTHNREFKDDPRIITGSKGIVLQSHKGHELLDGSSGLFCVPAGHGRPEIANAVQQQLLENGYCSSFSISHPGGFALSESLARIYPDNFKHSFFTNSGSEAVDTAIKIALAYHRAKGDGHRNRLVSRSRAYHGVNMGGTSLSGMVRNRETFSLTLPNVITLRHTWNESQKFQWGQPDADGTSMANELAEVCATYGGNTIAAVFVEPVAGSTGVLVPPKGYLERLREICDEHGILLIFDEVITGFGRLGTPFAADYFKVKPDIITLAKALTNGMIPMGAVTVQEYVYDTIVTNSKNSNIEFFHGYTYTAHPAACAAGIAVQNIYQQEKLFETANDLSQFFAQQILSLKDHPMVFDIRGIGLLAGIEVLPHPDGLGVRGIQISKILFENGLHQKTTGDVCIIAPAFISSKEQIKEMVNIISKSLDILAS